MSLRHNEVRDLLTDLLSESSCHNVTAEPHLQPLCGEQLRSSGAITSDEAGLDIKQVDFGGTVTRLRFLMLGSLTPTQTRIMPNPLHSCTGSTNRRSGDSMARGLERSGGEVLHHWCFLPQEELDQRHPFFKTTRRADQ